MREIVEQCKKLIQAIQKKEPDSRMRAYNYLNSLDRTKPYSQQIDREFIRELRNTVFMFPKLHDTKVDRCRFCGHVLPVHHVVDYCADAFTYQTQEMCWKGQYKTAERVTHPTDDVSASEFLSYGFKRFSNVFENLASYKAYSQNAAIFTPGVQIQPLHKAILKDLAAELALSYPYAAGYLKEVDLLWLASMLVGIYAEQTVNQLGLVWSTQEAKNVACDYYFLEGRQVFVQEILAERLNREPASVEAGELKGFAVCRS